MEESCFSSALGASALMPNPINVGTSSVQLCQKNPSRKEIIIINVGTTTLYLSLGNAATGSLYSFALSPCITANDGTGGVYISSLWQGSIHCISSAPGGILNLTEEV